MEIPRESVPRNGELSQAEERLVRVSCIDFSSSCRLRDVGNGDVPSVGLHHGGPIWEGYLGGGIGRCGVYMQNRRASRPSVRPT